MARVLVTDDDPDIRRLLTTLLVGEDHDVSVATNGAEALAAMHLNPPEVLVLDIMMPGIDGWGVLREMKSSSLDKSIKTMVLTAKNSERDWLRGYKLGAHYYLPKPFDIDEFLDAINFMLQSSRSHLRSRRAEELEKARVLSQIESLFDENGEPITVGL
jgi:two-component system, OmpR family, response regulator MprA